ncbi:hypothetical protein EsVE80_21840 [Enterococcus saigonensis]|uniref:Uncharacterized protein n=1 Tax=Enterococcus saigonensis TaxID=1805431 RepID=A0A679IP57_9ENTE|nr:hypothetical protein [Enterococcus saigonensis]BCA86661.1 hypothetical protein EsVE80_21840 [Enterococcus saigonensis]
MREIIVWLSADGGNDIYETITVPNDFTEEQVEKVAKQAIFNNIDWGWYEKEDTLASN